MTPYQHQRAAEDARWARKRAKLLLDYEVVLNSQFHVGFRPLFATKIPEASQRYHFAKTNPHVRFYIKKGMIVFDHENEILYMLKS